MNRNRLAYASCILLPATLLLWGCGSSSSGSSNGPSLGTGGNTPLTPGTPAPGTGKGGVVPITQAGWDAALEAACNGSSGETEGQPAKIEMVVDVSSSMKQTTTGSNESKWVQTRDAIVAGFVGTPGGGTGLPNDVAVGLLFYPNVQTDPSPTPKDVSTCVNTAAAIPMASLGADVAGSQRQKLRDALNGMQLGPTGTPTWDAMNYATTVELLQKAETVAGNPYIVLITDGMPTLQPECRNDSGTTSDVDPEPIVQLIDGFYKKSGVKTFLIGSPGSESGRDWMSRAAVAGQTAAAGCSPSGPNYCHMDLTTSKNFGADLTAALKTIGGAVLSCEYNVVGKSIDETKDVDPMKTVVLASYSSGEQVLIARDDTPEDCTEGWYLKADTNQVVFCSETCKKVQGDSAAHVAVIFGCDETVIVPLQ